MHQGLASSLALLSVFFFFINCSQGSQLHKGALGIMYILVFCMH
jgi:hypothetical protein